MTISLFQAVGALQRPSWGHWNGLLASLRNARHKAVLRTGGAAQREKAKSGDARETLESLDRPCGGALLGETQKLAE